MSLPWSDCSAILGIFWHDNCATLPVHQPWHPPLFSSWLPSKHNYQPPNPPLELPLSSICPYRSFESYIRSSWRNTLITPLPADSTWHTLEWKVVSKIVRPLLQCRPTDQHTRQISLQIMRHVKPWFCIDAIIWIWLPGWMCNKLHDFKSFPEPPISESHVRMINGL